jgi:mycofactocin precursor
MSTAPQSTTIQPEIRTEVAPEQPAPDVASVIAEDSLVEEVSIDGMCGVY